MHCYFLNTDRLRIVFDIETLFNLELFLIPLQSEKFKENVVSCLLKEISQACPSFPTQKMYTILKEKQDEEVIEETGACLTYKSEIDLIYD